MAEGALFHLAGNVINVLGSFIAEEVKLAFGVKTEIENLKSRVSTIQAVLLDAEKRSSQNHVIKNWLGKLKDVLHDADDVLDDFSTEVLRQKAMSGNKMTKEVRIFFSSSNPPAFGHKMGHEIKAISTRLNAIEKEMMAYHFSQSLVEPQVMNRGRETYSFVLKDEVIGRENDKEEIMKRLFDDSVKENISIIPIVGIGGMGKTTLAQLVYNDEDVQTKFKIKLWVCISDIFDVRRIVKEIVEQLTKEKQEGSLEILQNMLREELNGKKYLIVLDDLWNEDNNKWLLLRNLLMGGAKGSRIVVTTRLESVARRIGTTLWHALRGLPEEKAWSLFVKVAFEQGQEPANKALVAIGRKIVEKCDGLPLAIRTIGSILYLKTSEVEWQSFVDDELSKIGQQENISSTLKLSYDHLPSHLKQCFAYCRLFPKDHRINVHELINLWAAQGFIVLVSPKQRFEDVGREYFMELLWRSFFQEVENDGVGCIASCKMHDLVHDLASCVSGTESVELNTSRINDIEKVRHVTFNLVDSSSQFSILVANKRKIRTILAASVGGKLGNLTCSALISNLNYLNIRTILTASVGGKLGYLTCNALISNLNYLRTLDLSCLGLHVVPHSIGELSHLRYLDLSHNGAIVVLPDSITKLLNLQTLKLNSCYSLEELPRGLPKLVNLRHLDVRGVGLTHVPLGLGHLTSLEILASLVLVVRQGGLVSPYSWYKKKQAESGGGLIELVKLSNLGGRLEINLGHGEDDMVECKATNMKQKQHLQDLELWWNEEWDDGEAECYDDMSLEGLQPHPNLKALNMSYYMGVRIPSWVSSLTNLGCFGLYKNRRLQHLPPLNQLPFLKAVSLRGMEALEYIWIDEDSVSNVLGASSSSSSSSKTPFFPSLSSLHIENCPKLKGWWRNSDDSKDVDSVSDVLGASSSSSSSSSSKTPFFPSLSSLHLINCPKLKEWWSNSDDSEPHHLLLPSFPPSLSELRIMYCPNLTSIPLIPDLTVSLIYRCPLLRRQE